MLTFPSGSVFNHAIIQVLLNGKIYWIDPTINYQGGSLEMTCCPEYGYGLVVKRRRNIYHLFPLG